MGEQNSASAFMSFAAFARYRGVSKPAITAWKRRGYVAVTAAGEVDVAESNRRLAARPSARVGGTAKARPIEPGTPVSETVDSPANWSRQEALRQREIAQARLAQIEADTAAGTVVLKAEVASVVRAEYSIVRTALLGMASKLAHRLAAATTPEAAGALVDAEVRGLLEALTADGAP
jgi:hypothetical protein